MKKEEWREKKKKKQSPKTSFGREKKRRENWKLLNKNKDREKLQQNREIER